MKLRHPFLLQSAGLLGSALVRTLVGTLDCRFDHGPAGPHPGDARERRFIYAVWHDSLLLMTRFRTRVQVLVSQHADGELIAQIVRHFRFGLVRGSSRRGGTAALLRLLEVSRHSHLFVTPDGPRGPRRRLQPGIVFAASHTGLPIVPVGVGYARAWHAKSWDRFAVPMPFSTARIIAGEPVSIPAGLDLRQMADYRERLEERLLALSAEAERWAAGLPRKEPAAVEHRLARSA